MTAEVKLAGRLPGSIENNGMYSQHTELLDSPKQQRLAVVWYDVLRITRDVETGDEIPTLRVLRIEPMGETDEASAALRELVLKRAEDRLGHTPLPFDETDPAGVRVHPDAD